MNLITYKVNDNEETQELILEKATKTQDIWMIVRLSAYYPSVLLFTDEKEAKDKYTELSTAPYNADDPFLFAKAEMATEYLGGDCKSLTGALTLGDISKCNVEWYL